MKAKFYSLIMLIPILIGIGSLKIFADSWVQKTNFGGSTREYSVAFSIGSKGYIGMGIDNNTIYRSDLWEYDTGSNTWTQKANFPSTGRRGATGFAIGIKGYVGTGEYFDGFNTLFYNDFWEYDPGGNTWKRKANFGGVAREWAVGFAIGNKGYIGTGNNGTGIYNDFWEYDQGTNTWTQRANFGGPIRTQAVGFAIGTSGYIGTGCSTTAFYNDFWEFDQGTGTWTQKANFSGMGRYEATSFAIGIKGYIGTGGYHDSLFHSLNDFWEYDPSSNTWMQKTNFSGTAREGATGFATATKGFIGTGYGGGVLTNDFWEYTPDSINAIEEISIANVFNIYPNPLTFSSILQFNTQLKDAEVVIYDMVGKEIWTKSLRGGTTKQSPNVIEIGALLETRKLESGVYFVMVKSEERQWVQKMVVE